MHLLVRKTLEVYLREKRIPTLSDIPTELQSYTAMKDSVFVTLYYEGRVIASSGRLTPKKDNTFYECIDNTLMCLKDPRFTAEIQDLAKLPDIRIRTDRFGAANRRILPDVTLLDTKNEWLILLSQNLGFLSIILPHMVHIETSAQGYFSLACKKVSQDPAKLTPADYVVYGLTTMSEADFGL
jgi:hypothetical protein